MYNPQLETFVCVVESGSYSKSAVTVKYTKKKRYII